jgi:hypothetical protein
LQGTGRAIRRSFFMTSSSAARGGSPDFANHLDPPVRNRFCVSFDVPAGVLPMTFRSPLLFGALSLALGSVAPFAGAAPLAILANAKGTVQLLRGGKSSPAKSGASLQSGDVVKVEKGLATVYYAARPPQVIGSGRQVTINSAGGKGSGAWKAVYSGLSSGFERRTMEAPGSLRGDRLSLVAPFNSSIMEMRPVFVWEPYRQDGYDLFDYLVSVRDASGAEIWHAASKSPSIAYPSVAPALKPGVKYVWSVSPRQLNRAGEPEADDSAASRTGSFRIAAPEEIAAVRREIAQLSADLKDAPEETKRLALAALLGERGFKSAAIQALTPEIGPAALGNPDYAKLREAAWSRMEEPNRMLLRSLYLDTKRNALVQRIDRMSSSPAKPVSPKTAKD